MADIRNRKVLIIGIDGGTWNILTPAIEQGFMPNLKEIVDSGASGILESTMPAITPAAWGSFQTGVNCGRNGVFDFAYWDKSENKAHYVSSSTLQTTLWEMASAAGKRVGFRDVQVEFIITGEPLIEPIIVRCIESMSRAAGSRRSTTAGRRRRSG